MLNARCIVGERRAAAPANPIPRKPRTAGREAGLGGGRGRRDPRAERRGGTALSRPGVAADLPFDAPPAAPVAGLVDAESRRWLRDLRAEGPPREQALARLHALLFRAASFEVARRRPGLPHLRGDELDEIAAEAAHDALMAVLARLDDFRGASRFTTWAYKFALLEASVKLRRRAWQGREVPLEPDTWSLFASLAPGPAGEAEQRELMTALRRGIAEALTPHQRRVLVALVLNGVPIDVLADRLGSTRGAVYKTLHDARQRLRRHLAAGGLSVAACFEGEAR